MDQDIHAAARHPAHPRQRPLSRASTSSGQSATTQPNMDQSNQVNAANPYAGQWMTQDHGNHENMGAAQQMPPDVMMLQAATHMQAPAQDFPMDGSMDVRMAHQMQYNQQQQSHQPHPQHNLSRHPLPGDQFSANGSFVEGDSHMMGVEDDDSQMPLVGVPRPTGGRSSANNELEMRQLFQNNRERKLQEVAADLHGNERGPNAERSRQVFAMLWINQVCSKGRGSVPRGRVYANYASRCATERITVLNPASFGKLVRVLFPGLKTRRLGVRGESKYHYVNFALMEEQPEFGAPPAQLPRSLSEPSASQTPDAAPRKPSSSSGRAAVPPPQNPGDAQAAPVNPNTHSRGGYSVYNLPEIPSSQYSADNSQKTPLELSFSAEGEYRLHKFEPVVLPRIEPFLPQGTDYDSANSLSAIYRSHCTSLVECIRRCRGKAFFHLYSAFQGTLTMPVQKIFNKPELAPWIEMCDLVMYQRMMAIIYDLALQDLPKSVMTTLKSISEQLVSHIQSCFQGQPEHVLRAKEAPAALFTHLMGRVLRVNLTTHAAFMMLKDTEKRSQMYYDWSTAIRPRDIAQCVPTRGMDDVVDLLMKQMRHLINPDDEGAQDTEQGEVSNTDMSAKNVLDRWVALMRELPEKFPYASPADIVACSERVGTSLVRDLSLANCLSFGSWWVLKMWVDELIAYEAAHGGFMKMVAIRNTGTSLTSGPEPASVEAAEPKLDNATEKVNMSAKVSQSQPGRAPFPPPSNSTQAPAESVAEPHDDSGIGIRTPEEEFPMEKYTFSESNGGLMAEDPAAQSAM